MWDWRITYSNGTETCNLRGTTPSDEQEWLTLHAQILAAMGISDLSPVTSASELERIAAQAVERLRRKRK